MLIFVSEAPDWQYVASMTDKGRSNTSKSQLSIGSVLWAQYSLRKLFTWRIAGLFVVLLAENTMIFFWLRLRHERRMTEETLSCQVKQRALNASEEKFKEAENARINMTGRLINAQEEERARIARELHDDINQRVALLANGFRHLDHSISQNRAGLIESQRLFQLTTELSVAVQELSHQLHSSKLEYLGLAAAVRSLSSDFSRAHNIDVTCIIRELPTLDLQVSLSVFRCIQEALRNVAKHSEAKHAKVELIGAFNAVRLRVSDDGIGFDVHDPASHSGLGLISMGERLRWVGGEFSIWSKPSLGTQVEGVVPIGTKQIEKLGSLAG